MDRYSEVKHLITVAQENGIVNFAEFGNGISEEWLEKAENRLGFALPETYKWWCKNYRGGEINGDEIYSIYGMDWDTLSGGDIVHMYELDKKHNQDNASRLAISEPGVTYYFDLTRKDAAGSEYPVYYSDGIFYANDFLEFLKRRIDEDAFIL